MEVNKVATALVAIVITIVVIGTVAVPIVDEAVSGTSYKGTNTNYESRYTLLMDNPEFSLERNSGGTTITAGGSTWTVNTDGNPAVIVSDAVAMRVTSTGIVIWNFYEGTFETIRDMSTNIRIYVTENSSVMWVNNEQITIGPVGFALLKNPSGDWGVFTNQGFKITVGQEYFIGSIYGEERFGPTRLVSAMGDAAYDDIIMPSSASGSMIVSAGEVAYDISYTESEGSQKVGLVSDIVASWNNNGGKSGEATKGEPTRAVTTVTEFHAWAPLEFKSTATGDAGTDGLLLSIIPVLLIIVAIMMAVRVLRGD